MKSSVTTYVVANVKEYGSYRVREHTFKGMRVPREDVERLLRNPRCISEVLNVSVYYA